MRSLLLSLLVSFTAATPALAQYPYTARVCTRDLNGYVNVRAVVGLYSPIVGRANNNQYLMLSGWYGDQDGFRWHQLTTGGWIRGDYLCNH